MFASPMPESFLVVQLVENPPAVWETWVRSLGWEDPLEEGKATHCRILAWRIPWTVQPSGLQSMGSQRVGHGGATNTPSPVPEGRDGCSRMSSLAAPGTTPPRSLLFCCPRWHSVLLTYMFRKFRSLLWNRPILSFSLWAILLWFGYQLLSEWNCFSLFWWNSSEDLYLRLVYRSFGAVTFVFFISDNNEH